MSSTADFVQVYSWAIKLGLIIFIALVLSLAEYIMYRKYLPVAHRKNHRWRKIVVTALHGPFICYVWLMVITIIFEILSGKVGFDGTITFWLNMGRHLLTLLFLLWFVMRFIRQWEKSFVSAVENGHKKTFRDATSVNALAQVFRVVSIIIIFLMMMSTAGFKISTLLAAGGIGGLALSFAAKDTLANFIGGLMVYWDRPFSVGDWVASPDRKIEGTVINIGWRLTTIRTFDKRPLYVPNATFSTISVENPSRMLNRRIKTLVGVRYDDASKVAAIVKDITDMLANHPDIDTTQTWFVRLVEFGSSSLNILIYTFTKTTEWLKFQAIQEDVFLKIIDIVGKHGAEFAFPTSTIHVPEGIKTFNEEVNELRSLR